MDRQQQSSLLEFPFLIGTVRTFVKGVEKAKVRQFPFLIGTVRTGNAVGFRIIGSGFHSS